MVLPVSIHEYRHHILNLSNQALATHNSLLSILEWIVQFNLEICRYFWTHNAKNNLKNVTSSHHIIRPEIFKQLNTLFISQHVVTRSKITCLSIEDLHLHLFIEIMNEIYFRLFLLLSNCALKFYSSDTFRCPALLIYKRTFTLRH